MVRDAAQRHYTGARRRANEGRRRRSLTGVDWHDEEEAGAAEEEEAEPFVWPRTAREHHELRRRQLSGATDLCDYCSLPENAEDVMCTGETAWFASPPSFPPPPAPETFDPLSPSPPPPAGAPGAPPSPPPPSPPPPSLNCLRYPQLANAGAPYNCGPYDADMAREAGYPYMGGLGRRLAAGAVLGEGEVITAGGEVISHREATRRRMLGLFNKPRRSPAISVQSPACHLRAIARMPSPSPACISTTPQQRVLSVSAQVASATSRSVLPLCSLI